MGPMTLFSVSVVAVVFVWSGAAKARDPAAFAASLSGFRVPVTFRLPIARITIGVEIASAVAVLIPATRTIGLSIAAMALFVFSAAITSVLVRGEPVSCRCFGGTGSELRAAHVARNLGLAAVAVAGALGTDPAAAVSSVEAATAIGAGLIVALGTTSLDAWLEFLAPRNPQEVS